MSYYNAYYYSFISTEEQDINDILINIADAGKGYHHTEYWSDPLEYRDDKKSYIDLIQESANSAARQMTDLKQREVILTEVIEDLLCGIEQAIDLGYLGEGSTNKMNIKFVKNARKTLEELGVQL